MKISFLAGLAVGAMVGMILAPKRGKELRANLRKKFDASRNPRYEENLATEPQASSLNTATREQLLAVYGIGPVLADRIIENRPYTTARDVVERGIISEGTFAELEKSLLKSA